MDVLIRSRDSAVAVIRARLGDRLGTRRAMRVWSIALLVANLGIIGTGAVVRLTGSGLGCPTWPRCTPESYVTTPEMGIHGVIEFGNRLLTFVLIMVAVVAFLAALCQPAGPRARRLTVLTLVIGFGIPFQGVIGGITVLTRLNPYVVALHLLLSMVLVALSVMLVRTAFDRAGEPVGSLVRLPRATFVAMWLVVWLGTVVTGSGPHAGDADAPRNGLDPEVLSHVHAISVYLAVALTVITLIALRSRAAVVLLAVEVAQGGIGFVQYYNGLPAVVVTLHLLGAGLAIAAATNLLLSHPRSHDRVLQPAGAPGTRRTSR